MSQLRDGYGRDMAKTASPTVHDVPSILERGFGNYRRSLVPASAMAVLVILVYGSARIIAQNSVDEGNLGTAFAIDALGLVLATVLALPWFRLALATERGSSPANLPLEWGSMLVAALFFWGGILLGIRYMVGIPSIFMLVWYGLFGFAVAAGTKPGLNALGTSVRLGQGRRWAVAATAAVLAFLNLLGLLPIGSGLNPLTATVAVLLLVATTNISMGAGAHLYDRLKESEAP